MTSVVRREKKDGIMLFPVFPDGVIKSAVSIHICPEFFKGALSFGSEAMHSPVIVSVIKDNHVVLILFNELKGLEIAEIMVIIYIIVNGSFLENLRN